MSQSQSQKEPSQALAVTPESLLVVGLDFGTTFSGASWAYRVGGSSDSQPFIHVVNTWPQKSGQAKAPTQIALRNTIDNHSQNKSDVLWGYGIPDSAVRASWLKLLLLDERDLPADIRNWEQFAATREYLGGKEPGSRESLISQYLAAMWQHILSTIHQSLGPDVFESCQLKIIFTVPAMWPHYAQARMAVAAEKAGITNKNDRSSLAFMSEPEAVALSNFYQERRFMQHKLTANDTFVVCDAGGGTVDLITYRAAQCSESSLVLEEVLPGQGELCGAAFLDEAFEKLLASHFGIGWKTATAQERRNVLEDGWNHRIKPDFNGVDTLADLSVLVPMDCRDHVKMNVGMQRSPDHWCSSYEFTRDEIASVFDPIFAKITCLISNQIDGALQKTGKLPKYVILSGGLGQSKYLHQKVKAMPEMSGQISVLQGMDASSWSAVSRGAVIQGLNGYLRPSESVEVRSRVSRASYGTLQYEIYDASIHDVRDFVWSDEEGDFVAEDLPVWFLKYGDTITEGSSVRFEFYSLHPMSRGVPSTHEVTIFYCCDSAVPTRLEDNVKELCTIKWSDNSQSQKQVVLNGHGEEHYAVCFDVEMIVRGPTLEFAVLVAGEKVAAKNVEVHYTTPNSIPDTPMRSSGMTRVTSSVRRSHVITPKSEGGTAQGVELAERAPRQSGKRKRESTPTPSRKRGQKRKESWIESDSGDERKSEGSWRS